MVNLGRRDPQWAGGARRTTTHGGHTHCGRARKGTVATLSAQTADTAVPPWMLACGYSGWHLDSINSRGVTGTNVAVAIPYSEHGWM